MNRICEVFCDSMGSAAMLNLLAKELSVDARLLLGKQVRCQFYSRAWWQGSGQKMRCRTLDFIEYASQMRDNYHAQLDCRAGSHAASFLKCFDHAIQRIVLAEEENVVLASKVVVKICRRKRSSGGNV